MLGNEERNRNELKLVFAGLLKQMDDSFTESHGKNGVLRKFNDDTLNDVSRAKVSQDGSFCSALTSQGLVTFSVLSSQPVKLHLPGKIEGYVLVSAYQITILLFL